MGLFLGEMSLNLKWIKALIVYLKVALKKAELVLLILTAVTFSKNELFRWLMRFFISRGTK